MDFRDKEKERIILKFKWLSDKYHNLSLLFNELSKSLEIESRNRSLKEFKEHIKSLNLDYEKLSKLTKGLSEISLKDIKKREIED